MPLAYIPKSLANTARSEPVTAIYLCAYAPTAVSAPPKPGASVNGTMTNHWVMYLVASSTQSIRFDPSPTGPGNSLDLIITSKNHAYTNNAVKSMHLTPTANLTVGHVFDHITNCKYDNYTFSAGGQGCRFWIYSVVELLSSAGYITDSSEVNASTEALGIVWTMGGGRVPAGQQTGMTKGTF
ncbi:hypothetical protein BKA61DRAFT_607372 [Leptodontidium sp. MPI-SDFR-AT-0119]|nr:hypothetical protein BKA61DRAFT_607372 [Leptodontidium sp. MPI-SDFR-AT-0119]